jgi:hypothetical protein
MARLTARVGRLERRAAEASWARAALDAAREQGGPAGELVAMMREALVWWRWESARHPLPVLPDGRVDMEPAIRRWAAWAGVDPDTAVGEMRTWVEPMTKRRPGARCGAVNGGAVG